MVKYYKYNKSDVKLSVDTGLLVASEETIPLFLKQKTCKYDFEYVNGIVTNKPCRELRVKGSAKDAEVIIEIREGVNPPRIFSFTNDLNFELVEKLKKRAKVFFKRGPVENQGRIQLEVLIIKH